MWAFYFQPTNQLIQRSLHTAFSSPVQDCGILREKMSGIICIPLSSLGERVRSGDSRALVTSRPLITLHYQRCQHVSAVSWPNIVSREQSENKACNNETIQMHTWAIDTLDTLTIQSHDIIWIRARSQNQNHPDYLTRGCQTMLNVFPNQRQSVNLSCTLNPCVSISLSCHVSIPSHRHLMQISDRLSLCSMTLANTLSSPLMLSCSPGQAAGPTEQRSSAGRALACDAPHKPQ